MVTIEEATQISKDIIEASGNHNDLEDSISNNENAAVNNNNNRNLSKLMHDKTGNNRKHKRFFSQQQQRKINKTWKLRKNKRQLNKKELVDTNSEKKNRKFRSTIKFKNSRFRTGTLSKFFLPDKINRKDLIVPPTKFLLGGNISDPLNLNSLQNEASAETPKSSPITTPPKIEVIIPPNIHDPLHLLDPVDAIEYQKQLSSPIKKRKKIKHRKRKKIINNNSNESTIIASNVINEDKQCKKICDTNITVPVLYPDIIDIAHRSQDVSNLKLELTETGRKRKTSETLNCGKLKIRRTDSLDKIVSPVVPQPGAWKRLPWTIPNAPPRVRNRSYSASMADNIPDPITDITKVDEPKEEILINTPKSTNTNSPKMPNFKNEDARYQYGNYDRYNNHRSFNEFIDVRLQVFRRNAHLFRNKDILDIGCNTGNITIAVAESLEPNTITGIDIDSKLIEKARKHLSMIVKLPKKLLNTGLIDTNDSSILINKKLSLYSNKNSSEAKLLEEEKSTTITENINFFPISFPNCFGPIPELSSSSHQQTNKNFSKKFPKNVFFKVSNYVLKDELLTSDSQQYDLILCLSVTKWIHLNFGDAGVKLSFKRIFNQLRPGGKLILEAQNWASYKKKKKLTKNVYNNYQNIEFFPNKFHEYLLSSEVGFSHSYPLGVPRHLSKGFKRPILLYVKGDFTPSQIRWSSDTHRPQTPYEPYRGIYADSEEQSHSVRKFIWGSEPRSNYHPNYGYQFTPSQHLRSSSQYYYNPFETDSYLPSYDSKVQKRQYCFASPLYSSVWSPVNSSKTPIYSVREDDADGQNSMVHVYSPLTANLGERLCNRSADGEKSDIDIDIPIKPLSFEKKSLSPLREELNEFNAIEKK